jgi:crotonobetainyl-CoA:carnitine CoA-transferase CaiB-like acyl-CoA transferase
MKLQGIRVLDLSSFIPGPYLTMALADHGAEVIKVESPDGDPTRQIGLCDGPDTVYFRNFNRGKRSVVCDLKQKADREAFLALADTADIVVESNRPGVAKRLGVDYEAIAARNPRIIYCSITAFGQAGPLAQRPEHELGLEAMTGVLASNVGVDGAIAMPAVPWGDYLAGLQGLAAVLMALHARQATGRGDHIDISMQEALLSATANVLAPVFAEKRQPNPAHERATGGAAFYRWYDTADGRQLALAGQEPKFVTALLGELGRLDLAPLCREPGPHQHAVVALLRETFGAMTLSEAGELLDRLELCWGPVRTYPEALEDEQLAFRNFVLTDEQGRRHLASPIRFRDQPGRVGLQAPQLGADRVLLAASSQKR